MVIKGIKLLRKEFKGEIWLEIFIVPGINDSKNELNMIKSAISQIKPDKIQINSLDRPGTEKWVKPLGKTRRDSISKFLNAENRINLKNRVSNYSKNALDSIRYMIKRRPCTALEIAELAGLSLNETKKYLHRLSNSGRLIQEKQNRGIFYKYV
jgi:wyosine [tRNA(Phe)-imidazoG37] synthetase (radical SAM superfamily)